MKNKEIQKSQSSLSGRASTEQLEQLKRDMIKLQNTNQSMQAFMNLGRKEQDQVQNPELKLRQSAQILAQNLSYDTDDQEGKHIRNMSKTMGTNNIANASFQKDKRSTQAVQNEYTKSLPKSGHQPDDIESSNCATNPKMVLRKNKVLIYVYKVSETDKWFEFEDPDKKLDFNNDKYCEFINEYDGCMTYKILNEQEFIAHHLDYTVETSNEMKAYSKTNQVLGGLIVFDTFVKIIITLCIIIFATTDSKKDRSELAQTFSKSNPGLKVIALTQKNLISTSSLTFKVLFGSSLGFQSIIVMYGIYALRSHQMTSRRIFDILLGISLIFEMWISLFSALNIVTLSNRIILLTFSLYTTNYALGPLLQIVPPKNKKDEIENDAPLLQKDKKPVFTLAKINGFRNYGAPSQEKLKSDRKMNLDLD